jgi:proline racemase
VIGGRGVSLKVVDSHTCGQPTRVIVDGLPDVGDRSAAQARELLRGQHDWIRRLAVFEPRGYPALLAVALFPLSTGAEHWRLVFMDAAGYPDMCGHATIGVATTLVETGLLDAANGESSVTLDTPGGMVSVELRVTDGHVEDVKLINRPAYYLETVTVSGPSGHMKVPIAYGGQWYAFAEAAAVGLAVERRCVPELVRVAASLRALVAEQVRQPDPRTKQPPCVENIMWIDDPLDPTVDGRNMPVNRAGAFDRSPCGTGTSARLAVLHATGELAVGEEYVNSGVLGTVYRARIARTIEVAGTEAVVPEITGSAWLTGRAELWSDRTDPLASGFLL